MRVLVAIYFLLLVCPCFAADSSRADLKSLYDRHRWFELRDAVEKGGATAFYEGVVACAFNNLRQCEKKLGAVVKSRPQSDETVEAHRTLASAYFTRGMYRAALNQVDALLALRPKDADALSSRPLLSVLSSFHDQHLVRRTPTTLELQDNGLPLSIHGVQATYWFDTGAELSVMSESEAKRFRLPIRNAAIKVGDVNGTQVDTKVAVADEISFGPVRLKDVAFLVVPDNQPPFDEIPPGSRGLIGIPVILAFQKFIWSADRKFQILPKRSDRHAHAELCFDGSRPLVQVQIKNRNLAFPLDTGATNTDLYPPFAAEFPELIGDAQKTNSYKMEGVGGAKFMNAATLESLQLRIGGFPVVLKGAGVLLTTTSEASKFFEGNLGIDLLQQAHRTTFDFKAMTLTLE